MTLTSILRASAFVVAGVGVLDPAWTSQGKSPLPVDVRAASPADGPSADQVRQRVREVDDVAVDGNASAAAVVLVGTAANPQSLPSGIPVSVVTHADGPNVAVQHLALPRPLLTGLTTRIEAVVSATRMAGATSRIRLEVQGIELAAIDHRWTSDREAYTARFEHVPPAAGAGVIRVSAGPLDNEMTTGDNHADVQAIVEDRKLRVLIHEPRLSWTATFVRRALEEDPVFEVTALARPSRGISARAGSPPEQLSTRALERFDVVIVGAPEELRQSELTALAEFSERRGGTVVFAPDRRPTGPYAASLPVARFEESLFPTPAALLGTNPAMKGSEFITVADPSAGVETLASLPRQKGPALSERSESKGSVPVIVSWPTGAGHTIFSGALDAWRYRTDGEAFGRFWKALIADAAARAPRALEIELDPGPAAPGELVHVKARLRPTEFIPSGSTIEFPRVSGRIVAADGGAWPMRLWPAAEDGVFDGHFRAPAPGRLVVELSAGAVTSSQPLIVAAGSRSADAGSPASLRQLANATGGVTVSTSDLSRLNSFLAGMTRPLVMTPVHPARSTVFALTFITLLSLEWWLRRRQGHA
jgi:hypothetical protein